MRDTNCGNTGQLVDELSLVILTASWTLALGDRPPVAVQVGFVDGPRMRLVTCELVPLDPRGKHTAYRAELTAPDGSRHTGVASVEGITWRNDRTPTFRVSFTAITEG